MKQTIQVGLMLVFCLALGQSAFGQTCVAQPDARPQDKKPFRESAASAANVGCNLLATGAVLGASKGKAKIPAAMAGAAAGSLCEAGVNKAFDVFSPPPSRPEGVTITARVYGEVVGQRSSEGSSCAGSSSPGGDSGSGGGGGGTNNRSHVIQNRKN